MKKAKKKGFDGWAFKYNPGWDRKWGNAAPDYEEPVTKVFSSGKWVKVRFVEVKPAPRARPKPVTVKVW